jgi:hypothetical protein
MAKSTFAEISTCLNQILYLMPRQALSNFNWLFDNVKPSTWQYRGFAIAMGYRMVI